MVIGEDIKMNSKNIIIFDESKFGNGSLFCFVGLVYKDTGIFNKIENELQQIKGKGDVPKVSFLSFSGLT